MDNNIIMLDLPRVVTIIIILMYIRDISCFYFRVNTAAARRRLERLNRPYYISVQLLYYLGSFRVYTCRNQFIIFDVVSRKP